MRVLIVESIPGLAWLWRRHLLRQGAEVRIASTEAEAIAALEEEGADVIVLDLTLDGGSALAVADYARYRRPEAGVVFVSSTSFFADGSIFVHVPNARAFLARATPPEDLAAVVGHHGGA